MPFPTLIVDDEPLAREGLRELLASDPDFTPVHEAKNGREAIEAIEALHPALVFLDVQMPEMDGFAVIEAIGAGRMPAIVFVTAHDRYAIQAFDINAIDYLLKPVTAARFAQTLERVKLRLKQPGDAGNHQILSLLETLAAPHRYTKRLAVRAQGKMVFVEVEDIDWIEAAENYVHLHTARGGHLLHVAMSTLEKSLDPEVFLRIHRSVIVNVRAIQELQPLFHGEYAVTLRGGVHLQSGRNYSARLKALASNPF